MSAEVWPTEDVYLACLRGLDLLDRRRRITDDHGGTEVAVAFAETLRDGFPADIGTCAQVVEAHKTLIQLPAHVKQHPKFEVTRLLWGGDRAIDWAQAALDSAFHARRPAAPLLPSPTPVAAAVGDRELQAVLDSLTVEIGRIEDEMVAALRAAFWVAYRSALRRAGQVATSRVNGRVPVAAQAAAGMQGEDLNGLRARLEAVHPWDRWSTAAPILAAIPVELDTILIGELEDFEATASSILEEGTAGLVALIAARLGVARDVLESLVPDVGLRLDAARRAANGLLDWVRARLSGDRDPDDLSDLIVPEPLFRETIGTAGGVVDPLVGFSVGAPLVDRVLEAAVTGRVSSTVLPERVTVTREWVWRRGRPRTPHPDHVDLGGVTWTTDVERIEATGGAVPGDHGPYCQCSIESRWRLVPVG